MQLQKISPRWTDLCVVAATGPSLSPCVAQACKGHHCIAVNDAYKLFPFADVLYAGDADWWDVHQGAPQFKGEKWTVYERRVSETRVHAERYGLNLIRGKASEGFSTDPSVIHYGSNSGFQAINLAILFGAKRIVLVGFDMRTTERRHFFGNHPEPLGNEGKYEHFIPEFRRAAKRLPDGVEIINCTPGSALDCFTIMPPEDVL